MREVKLNTYVVTGTYHGSIIEAESEGEARRLQAKATTNDSQLWDEDDRDAEMIFERAETLIEDSIQREIEQKL